jgi:hypothetical protein
MRTNTDITRLICDTKDDRDVWVLVCIIDKFIT